MINSRINTKLYKSFNLYKKLLATIVLSSTTILFESSCNVALANEQNEQISQSIHNKWQMWNQFLRNHFENGRIVDHSNNLELTTSEGQSYAMFFSIVMDDQKTFDELLKFTEETMAKGDISQHLPAWAVGPSSPALINLINGKYYSKNNYIIAENNATDSDLWIAYNLLEAADKWNNKNYKQKAIGILNQLKNNCVYSSDILGNVLLPGRFGFVHSDYVTLNPSYYPPFIFERISKEDPSFKIIYSNTMSLVLKSAGQGWFADWIDFNKNGQFMISSQTKGSWDALRVYLWFGITNSADPYKNMIKEYMGRALNYAQKNAEIPEEYKFIDMSMSKKGGIAYNVAMIPWAYNNKNIQLMRTKVAEYHFERDDYYSHILSLFALGYDNRYYRFNRDGSIQFKP